MSLLIYFCLRISTDSTLRPELDSIRFRSLCEILSELRMLGMKYCSNASCDELFTSVLSEITDLD